jgi:hypothetical protein
MPIHRCRCPYCKREIQLNDEQRKSSHQWPVCAGWEKLMKSTNARELGAELLEPATPKRKSPS